MTQIAIRNASIPFNVEFGSPSDRLEDDPALPGFVLDLEPIWQPA